MCKNLDRLYTVFCAKNLNRLYTVISAEYLDRIYTVLCAKYLNRLYIVSLKVYNLFIDFSNCIKELVETLTNLCKVDLRGNDIYLLPRELEKLKMFIIGKNSDSNDIIESDVNWVKRKKKQT